LNVTALMTPALAAASTSFLASAAVIASGLSETTCLPRAIAASFTG
jgi:hypothetical protein